MHYHIIIAQERRISTPAMPRQLAISINTDTATQTGVDAKGMPIFIVTPRPAQLHSMGDRIADVTVPNILYAAEWDGISPYINVLKGNISDPKMAYAGWPLIDKATWLLQNPANPHAGAFP